MDDWHENGSASHGQSLRQTAVSWVASQAKLAVETKLASLVALAGADDEVKSSDLFIEHEDNFGLLCRVSIFTKTKNHESRQCNPLN